MTTEFWKGAPEEIRNLAQEMSANIARESMRRTAEAAKKDPKANRLTTVFDNDTSYRYFPTKNKRGTEVRFCYSTKKNVAGYFLVWRETITKKGDGKRDQFDSTKTKKDAIAECRRRAAA